MEEFNDTAGNLLHSSEFPIVVQNNYLYFARDIHKIYYFFIQIKKKMIRFFFLNKKTEISLLSSILFRTGLLKP